MIVHNLNVESVRIKPSEADSPLIVNANTKLSHSVSSERFKTIPGYRTEVRQQRGGMDLIQLSLCHSGNSLVFPAELTLKNSLGLFVPKGPDHSSTLLPRSI